MVEAKKAVIPFEVEVEENHRLNLELESKKRKIKTPENVSSSQAEENERLEPENKKFRLMTQPGNTLSTFVRAREIESWNLIRVQ